MLIYKLVIYLGDNTMEIVSKNNNDGNLRYDNKLNTCLSFPEDFTALDYNLFFTICNFAKYKMRSNGKKIVTLPFSALQTYLPVKIKNKKRFYEDVVKFTKKKILNVSSDIEFVDKDNKREFRGSSFFNKIIVNEKREFISFELSSIAISLLFYFEKYMDIDLKEFCSLTCKYSKSVYRILIQYKRLPCNKSGKKILFFTKDEFKRIVNCPKNYNKNDIHRKVIEPISAELNNGYFNSVEFEEELNSVDNEAHRAYQEHMAAESKKLILGYRLIFDDSNRDEKGDENNKNKDDKDKDKKK